MFNIRTEDEIKRDMLKNIKNTSDKTENSIVHDALAPAAIEFQDANAELDYISSKLDVENLEGEELETFVKQRTNTERKLATRASEVVVIEGNEGSIVRTGDLVSTEDVTFIVQETKQIGTIGKVEVLVECEVEGSTGNVPAHTIVNFPVSLQGINSVTNEKEITNGYDDETDNELRARYYERIRTPATSGNKYHYLNWTKEVEGVGDARVIPTWQGPGTVKVVIIDSNKNITNVELVSKVFEHIESVKPVCGGTLTVVSATSKAINITAKIKIANNYTIQQVKKIIESNIEDYRKKITFKESYISFAVISNVIFDSEGVLDYSDLKLNNLMQNISLTDEEIPEFTVVLELIV